MKELSSVTYREIMRQPACFKGVEDTLPALYEVMERAFSAPCDLVIFTGCGTSHYLACAAMALFTEANDIPAMAVPCSELYHYPARYCKGRRVLVVPFTRKSVTTEVRMAIARVRALPNVESLAITCCLGSREYNDFVLYSPDADERSVIMTGTFSSMLYVASALALHLAGRPVPELSALAAALLPETDAFARDVAAARDFDLAVMLGQGAQYGVALESANKVKEMSITHAEAHITMEYRHGPMSLADERTLLCVFACGETWETDAALLSEIKGFGALTCAIGYHARERFPDADFALELPTDDPFIAAPLASFAGQLLGYHLSLRKGIDADAPRHLTQAIVLPEGK